MGAAPQPRTPTRCLRPLQRAHAGCVLGAAIGDAMGHPTEFQSMAVIRAAHGPAGVRGFTLYWERDGQRFAPYTDDTQMAEAVLRSLLESREAGEDLDAAMTRLAGHFVTWAWEPQGGHRAPGNACLAGCRALASGIPWHRAGAASAGGCGSVMRAWPVGLLFHDDLARAEAWAVAQSRLTHNHPIALAASAALAVGIAWILHGAAPAAVADAMIAAAGRQCPETAAMLAAARDDAVAGADPEAVFDRLRGFAAHEAIAGALFLFLRHPDDPSATILGGANTPGDSDSLASLAGALVGARCGLDALPPEWVAEVERSAELLALVSQI